MPNFDITSGDLVYLAIFIAFTLVFLTVVHFLPKEDLGPDPDKEER